MRMPRTRRCRHAGAGLLICLAIALTWEGGCSRRREPGKVCRPVGKFTASEASKYQGFGISVSMSGKLAVIAACSEAKGVKTAESAYVFDLVGLKEVAKLTPMGTARQKWHWLVSASGKRAVLTPLSSGPAAAAYVFDLDKVEQTAVLVAQGSHALDLFGSSVCISEDRVIVGASGMGPERDSAGVAYVLDARDGKQVFKLTPQHAEPGDEFGVAVALSDSFALVGAPSTDLPGAEDAGAAGAARRTQW